ncbi:MAG: AI-2E family transporter [Oscillospiraceae bacterium]|nr:AI-2E family transporter [Oscillospiraceae bacterium]
MTKPFIIRKVKSLIPYFLLALAVIVAYQIISQVSGIADGVRWIWGIVSPFFYGFLIAYILNIPASGIQWLLGKTRVKLIVRFKRPLSILLVFLLLILFVALLLNLLIPALIDGINLFISNFDTHYANAMGVIHNINNMDLFGLHIDVDGIAQDVLGGIQAWLQNFTLDNLAAPINAVIGASGAVFGGLFRFFLAMVSSIYILAGKDKIKGFFSRALRAFTPVKVNDGIIKYVWSLSRNFKRYIYVQTIDGLILGTLATIALWIMGSPYALILGLMLGIVNYIPYFGSIFGTAVAVIVVAFTQGLTSGVIALIGLLVIQQFDANFIQPKLMGGSFSLNPLLIIISITVGGALAGILGMLVAIPIISVLKDMMDNVIAYYERKRSLVPQGAADADAAEEVDE